MSYKRAEWHSGLTYRQSCETCNTTVEYQDDKLDFRPWYPDGFVYCPNCKSPLRHNENYAIDRPAAPEASAAPVFTEAPAEPVKTMPADNGAAFCSQCGKAFKAGDRFCSGCGSKREEETEAPVAAPVFAPAEPAAEPAAPVFTPAEPVADPAAEPEFTAGCEESAPEPAVPVFAPAEPVVEPVFAPAASAPIAAPKKYALKEKMPIAAIVLMGIAIPISLFRFISSFANFGGVINVFNNFVEMGAVVLMFVGMILHRKKGQPLTAVGSLCIAFTYLVSLCTDLFSGYSLIALGLFAEFVAISAFTIAGLYYLLKKPALGMPVKLILLSLHLVLDIIFWIRLPIMYGVSMRYFFNGPNILSILSGIFSAVALIIYTPFKKAKA